MSEPIKWSGKTSSYHHKWHDTPNPADVNEGFRKVWFLDAQWSTCPIEVEIQVKEMWKDRELGNDFYMIKTDILDLKSDYPIVAQYVLEKNPEIGEEETIVIHWWW